MKDVGAMGTIFDERGRVLLVHQTYKGSKWAWPGGVVELNESPWDAVVREVREETGLEVKAEKLVSIYSIKDNGGLAFQFLCRIVGGALQVDGGEISEAEFFDPHHLPVPMTKPGRPRVLDALAHCETPILREYDTVEVLHGD